MKYHLTLAALIVPLLNISHASDAFIKTEKSTGQGFLLERSENCYLITPSHVVEAIDDIKFMTADRKYHNAIVENHFDTDMSILKVESKKACHLKQPESKTRLSSLLKIYRDGVLKSRLSDGSILQTKVTIKGIDETEYLQIRPTKEKDILKQGYSGSVLYIGDQRAGMLLEVDTENTGIIYRGDAISQKISDYFNVSNSAENVTLTEKIPIQLPRSISDKITKNQVLEFKYSLEENSPIKLSMKGMPDVYRAYITIFDSDGREQFQSNFHGSQGFEYAFTPLSSGPHTFQLKGDSGFGKFDISLKQYALDAELRGAGNLVETGDRMTGVLAPKSIAEFKYMAQENSPIKLIMKNLPHDVYRAYIRILDSDGREQFQSNFHGSQGFEYAFTPLSSGPHTFQLKGDSGFGKFDISLKQYALDAELRGAGNLVETGDRMTGVLAPKSIAEFKYMAQENSPIKLIMKNLPHDVYRAYIRILDSDGREQFQSNFHGSQGFEYAFTPLSSGPHTFQLKGDSGFGKFDISLKQYALDAELRGAGNLVETGDRMTGVLAPKSIAEFKYMAQENSPIKLIMKNLPHDVYRAYIRILDSDGREQFQSKFHGSQGFEYAFTPLSSGPHTFQLKGDSGFGKFDISLKQYALDAELRGAGNLVETGDRMTGVLAPKSIAEFKYMAQENSPIKLIMKGMPDVYRAYITILDSDDREQFQSKFHGSQGFEYAFTPLSRGPHTFQLKGGAGFGKFDIQVLK